MCARCRVRRSGLRRFIHRQLQVHLQAAAIGVQAFGAQIVVRRNHRQRHGGQTWRAPQAQREALRVQPVGQPVPDRLLAGHGQVQIGRAIGHLFGRLQPTGVANMRGDGQALVAQRLQQLRGGLQIQAAAAVLEDQRIFVAAVAGGVALRQHPRRVDSTAPAPRAA